MTATSEEGALPITPKDSNNPDAEVKPRPEWQQRVIVEAEELMEKTRKLGVFIQEVASFNTLHPDERDRLRRQYHLMFEYHKVLKERIDNFVV